MIQGISISRASVGLVSCRISIKVPVQTPLHTIIVFNFHS